MLEHILYVVGGHGAGLIHVMLAKELAAECEPDWKHCLQSVTSAKIRP